MKDFSLFPLSDFTINADDIKVKISVIKLLSFNMKKKKRGEIFVIKFFRMESTGLGEGREEVIIKF
jgi:hypothetical protein